jgi:DNA-binding transcriptional ArsR family regulator
MEHIMLTKILGSQGRSAIFKILFTSERPTPSFHLREIARQAHISAPVLQRELNGLTEAGILLKNKDGNRTYYQANVDNPLYPTLCDLVHKTDNLEKVLKTAFSDDSIVCSFIFGSRANGEATAASDVDLFIVGEIGLRTVTARIHEAIPSAGFEINPYVITRSEFVKRRDEGDHFISEVMNSNKIFLKGNAHELETMEI